MYHKYNFTKKKNTNFWNKRRAPSEKLSKCIALQCNNQIKVAGKTNDK
jgi:hypothetical protein